MGAILAWQGCAVIDGNAAVVACVAWETLALKCGWWTLQTQAAVLAQAFAAVADAEFAHGSGEAEWTVADVADAFGQLLTCSSVLARAGAALVDALFTDLAGVILSTYEVLVFMIDHFILKS